MSLQMSLRNQPAAFLNQHFLSSAFLSGTFLYSAFFVRRFFDPNAV